MSEWEITHKSAYLEDFSDLGKSLQRAVVRAVKELEQDPVTPRGNTIKRLRGYENVWRYRLGDFRLVYAVDRASRLIRLLAVGPRGSVYERFNYEGWVAPGALVEFGPRMEQMSEWMNHPEWFRPDEPEPQRERLPRVLTPHILDGWRIHPKYHPILMRCLYAEDLMNVVNQGVPSEVLGQVLNRLYPPAVEHIAAQADQVLVRAEHLIEYAEGTLSAFLLRLDDQQKPLTNWALSGPTLVKGGPGSGKSTVALYRIRSIVEHDLRKNGRIPRILFTTFTNSLINFSESLLRQLLSGVGGLGPAARLPEQIRISTLYQIEREIVESSGQQVTIATKSKRIQALEAARERATYRYLPRRQRARVVAALDEIRDDYLLEEFDWVIEGQNCQQEVEYLEAERVGRGIPFYQSLRQAVWELYTLYDAELDSQQRYSYNRIAQLAFEVVKASDHGKKWDYVIVDEAQDLPPVAIALCVELCKRPTGLFLTADGNQSLYNKGFRWTYIHEDLNVQGRTRILRRNYRSTREIAAAASEILTAGHDDSNDQESLDQEFVHSGAYPVIYQSTSRQDEARWIARYIYMAAREMRLPPNAAAVLVSLAGDGEDLAWWLTNEGLPAKFMRSRDFELEDSCVKVTTLHAAKGLEFPITVIARAEEGHLPWAPTATDPQEMAEFLQSQRRLFYVGCTRAMRYLFVTHDRLSPSPFLAGLSDDRWMKFDGVESS